MCDLGKDGVISMSNENKDMDSLYNELAAEADKENAKEKKTKMEQKSRDMFDDIEEATLRRKRDSNELLRFFGGLLLFGAGLYMIFQNLVISSTWGTGGYIFHFGGFGLPYLVNRAVLKGGFGLPNGTIMIPLLLGIALLFLLDRKLWGWLFIAIGIVIIIAAVIMSVSIQWRTSNGWMFVVMFGLTFAGGAMMLRELFRSK